MTTACGWCLGPTGARLPHRPDIPDPTCPCLCHPDPKDDVADA